MLNPFATTTSNSVSFSSHSLSNPVVAKVSSVNFGPTKVIGPRQVSTPTSNANVPQYASHFSPPKTPPSSTGNPTTHSMKVQLHKSEVSSSPYSTSSVLSGNNNLRHNYHNIDINKLMYVYQILRSGQLSTINSISLWP